MIKEDSVDALILIAFEDRSLCSSFFCIFYLLKFVHLIVRTINLLLLLLFIFFNHKI